MICAVLASVLGLWSAGCGGNDTQEGPPASGSVVLKYSSFRVVDPTYIALQQGFFEKRGVEVEFVENPGGTTGLQAIASGRTQAASAPVSALVSAVDQGLPVIGVADQQSALEGSPVEQFYVRRGSGIRSVRDLRGRRVAVNSVGGSFQATVILALRKVGLDEKDVEFVILPFDQQAPALMAGRVDMIGLLPQFGTRAEAVFGNRIERSFDALDVLGPKQFVVLALNERWATENPEAATAFVGGIADAVEWIDANPAESRRLFSEYTRIEKRFLPRFRFQPQARVVESDAQFWIDYLRANGSITSDVASDDVVTSRFNPEL